MLWNNWSIILLKNNNIDYFVDFSVKDPKICRYRNNPNIVIYVLTNLSTAVKWHKYSELLVWNVQNQWGWLFMWRAVRSWKARRKRQKNRISMPAVEAEAAWREHRALSARGRRQSCSSSYSTKFKILKRYQ